MFVTRAACSQTVPTFCSCSAQVVFFLSQLVCGIAVTYGLTKIGVVSFNWRQVAAWMPISYSKDKGITLTLGKMVKDVDVNKDGVLDKQDLQVLASTNKHAYVGGATGFALGLLKGLGF